MTFWGPMYPYGGASIFSINPKFFFGQTYCAQGIRTVWGALS